MQIIIRAAAKDVAERLASEIPGINFSIDYRSEFIAGAEEMCQGVGSTCDLFADNTKAGLLIWRAPRQIEQMFQDSGAHVAEPVNLAKQAGAAAFMLGLAGQLIGKSELQIDVADLDKTGQKLTELGRSGIGNEDWKRFTSIELVAVGMRALGVEFDTDFHTSPPPAGQPDRSARRPRDYQGD